MNNPLSESKAVSIALYSEDARHWKEQDGSTTAISWAADKRVTRIIIGSLKEADDDDAETKQAQTILQQLPDDLAELYPNLCHLHLWRQTQLTQLPELPSSLLSLDLRFCTALTELPEDLPEALELLDLGGCTEMNDIGGLPPTLLRLYVSDCRALESLSLRGCKQLIEFDASHSPIVKTLKLLKPCYDSLAKLVLQGCENLSSLEGLTDFRQLFHVNLADCPKLTELPEIPDGIQYFALHGNEQLTVYKNQNLGPYDRGTTDEPNVAGRLYVRKVFGDKLAVAAQSKLLFLGDGRVGKTTLSKALRWYELSEEQRNSGEFDHIRPDKREPYTRDVRFDRWATSLQLQTQEASSLNQRAISALLPEPCDTDNRCDGTVRLWDFAGQELYHQTHRIFAAEGSVFVLVWSVDTSDAIDDSERDVSDEEWEEWNKRRTLDYWLDYIYSIRPDASITLVCTRYSGGEKPAWEDCSKKYQKRELSAFWIDSLNPGNLNDPDNEYRKLVEHLQSECGKEAARLGIMQPDFFSKARELLDQQVAQNQLPTMGQQVLLRRESDWYADLRGLDTTLSLKDRHLDAVTGYLNDSGMLIRVRSQSNPIVLIDQSWAASMIYRLLQRPPGGSARIPCLFNLVRAGEGVLNEADLAETDTWKKIRTEEEQSMLLDYMQQCGILVRILDAHEARGDKGAIFLATEKWLLPTEQQMASTLNRVYQLVKEVQGSEQLSFHFEKQQLSEFDFRALMVHLARHIGRYMHFFRNGLQVTDDPLHPRWCFRLSWQPLSEDNFYGQVEASLALHPADRQELVEQFEALMGADGSPLKRMAVNKAADAELSQIKSPSVTSGIYDLGISSAGAKSDVVAVEALIRELQEKYGLREYWYKTLAGDEDKRTLALMQRLPEQPLLLLCVSEHYMQLEPEQGQATDRQDDPEAVLKWFCMYELAGAITAVSNESRRPVKVMVLYLPTDNYPSEELDRFIAAFPTKAVKNFDKLINYFDKKTQLAHNDVAYQWRDLAGHFDKGKKAAASCGFLADVTHTGGYLTCRQTTEGYDVSDAAEKAARALGKT